MAFPDPADVPNLTARELLTVVALAENGSFVATSAYLNTSQPAVTRTLKRLEQRLGVTLFARNTRHVEITAAGREFVAVAERVLHDLQITVRSMRDIGSEQRGQVIVTTYSAFAYQVLPPILQAYRETRPQIDVRLREGRQPDILEDVRSGVADFGVGFVDGLQPPASRARRCGARRSTWSYRRRMRWRRSAPIASGLRTCRASGWCRCLWTRSRAA